VILCLRVAFRWNERWMETRHYRDLQVWQRSMSPAREVHAVTESFPRSEQFGLVSQIRQAAVSVPSSVAEGRGRATRKAFALFLSPARGSLYELQTQVELAGDLGFIGKDRAHSVMSEAAEIASMIQGVVGSLHD
jgi:four helix bundle protein